MKLIPKVALLLLSISFLTGCAKKDDIPANVEVNDFVWKGLNAYYLYQDQIPDLSDRRFSSQIQLNNYLLGFDTNSLFNSLLITTDNKSRLVEDYTASVSPPLRASFTHGMEFGIIAEPGHSDNVLGYVHYILPNSDASTKSIIRGEFFNEVDGVQLTRTNYLDLLVNGLDNYTLNIVDFDGVTVIPKTTPVTVDLTKTNYAHPAIFEEKVLSIGANEIGYLQYHNDFSENYIDQLNTAFLNLKNQSANQLILDLRYNIGGGSMAKTISQIGSMLTGQFTDDIFSKKQFNTKAQPWFIANQPDSLNIKFPTHLNSTTPINSLNLTDVYIITNGGSYNASSAIELLINSLNAHINVHVIGRTSSGNNTGAITLYNSEDYDFTGRSLNHTYAIEPVVLTFLNKNDETYENGLTPTMRICPNEDILNLGVLGETSDPLLARVLNYISTGNTGTLAPCNPNNFEYLYNSTLRQTVFDNGIFIEQDLPNTN